jgi:hypothetical protein
MAKRRNRRNKVKVQPVVANVISAEAVAIRAPDNFENVIYTLADVFESVAKYISRLLTKTVD